MRIWTPSQSSAVVALRRRRSGRRAGSPSPRSRSSTGVEIAGPVPEQSAPIASDSSASSGPAIDDVDEGRDRQTARRCAGPSRAPGPSPQLGLAAAAEVDRHRPRPLLEEQRRHVPPHQLPHFGPVGGDQHRLVAAADPPAPPRRESARQPPAPARPPAPAPQPRPAPPATARRRRQRPTHSTVPCPRSRLAWSFKPLATTSTPTELSRGSTSRPALSPGDPAGA